MWCKGNTPYPLVNACMRELLATGYLSNRGRQIVASCLINELKLDWRYGAAWFQQQLIDYDTAVNWGNWQYIAGVGADPAEVGTLIFSSRLRSMMGTAVINATGMVMNHRYLKTLETAIYSNMSHAKPQLPSRVCIVCRRSFNWRKKWKRDWDNVLYCSQGAGATREIPILRLRSRKVSERQMHQYGKNSE